MKIPYMGIGFAIDFVAIGGNLPLTSWQLPPIAINCHHGDGSQKRRLQTIESVF